MSTTSGENERVRAGTHPCVKACVYECVLERQEPLGLGMPRTFVELEGTRLHLDVVSVVYRNSSSATSEAPM